MVEGDAEIHKIRLNGGFVEFIIYPGTETYQVVLRNLTDPAKDMLLTIAAQDGSISNRLKRKHEFELFLSYS